LNTTTPKIPQRLRWPAVMAAVAGATAVLLGALGAHVLRRLVSEPMLDVWRTAVHFQFWHALALAICGKNCRQAFCSVSRRVANISVDQSIPPKIRKSALP